MKTVVVYLPAVSVVSGESVTLKQTRFDEEVDFLPFPMNVCLLDRVLSTGFYSSINRYFLPYLMPCQCIVVAWWRESSAHLLTNRLGAYFMNIN